MGGRIVAVRHFCGLDRDKCGKLDLSRWSPRTRAGYEAGDLKREQLHCTFFNTVTDTYRDSNNKRPSLHSGTISILSHFDPRRIEMMNEMSTSIS
jgi:hypothetical protein